MQCAAIMTMTGLAHEPQALQILQSCPVIQQTAVIRVDGASMTPPPLKTICTAGFWPSTLR